MAGTMAELRLWLRPPRNLLAVFLLVMFLPAATLVFLGVRLLEQDRALANQRQIEILEHSADSVVRLLEQDLGSLAKRLAGPAWTPAEVPEGSVYVAFHSEQIDAIPPGRLAYYPVAPALKEPPARPFAELESHEFKEQNLAKALEISRKLAASPDIAIRAGALVREARILRKAGQPDQALEAYASLSQIKWIALGGIPVDLVARRARCGILEAQSRQTELREEARAIEADLNSGKWQLDQTTFELITGKLGRWLGSEIRVNPEEEALAAAAAWLYKRWTTAAAGAQVESFGGVPVTILWASRSGHVAAFLAGPRYTEAHWLAGAQKAAHPARAHLLAAGARPVAGNGPPPGVRKVQRTAVDTGLPWALVVGGAGAAEESGDLAARRRILLAGFGALLILIAAGSYFIWRSVNRELAVARLQSDFVSAVSHEFRTPLTSLRQFTELLLDEDDLPPEKRRSYYQAQARATDRLHRFVESLLDFGRMEAVRRPYEFQRLDAGALAKDVTEEFGREVRGHGFEVDCIIDSADYAVDADPEALSRALWNLLDNAAKYSGESRKIELAVNRAVSQVSIEVRDHGLGIPAAEQKQIFQKFVRGAAAKSRGIKGTGIGLAMVRHIVEAHSGSVAVSSAPGEGSTFTIVLPAQGQGTENGTHPDR
jgi:signal transduction histidine kinase